MWFFNRVRVEKLNYMRKWYGKLCYFLLGLFFPLVFFVKILSADAVFLYILYAYGMFFLILHSCMVEKDLRD